jgi:small subunit ribosomal protein S17
MPRRVLTGEVVSNKTQQTVTIKVNRRVQHPKYGKTITRSKKYAAHDAKNEYKVGDVVMIRECRPMSKTKTWEVVELVRRPIISTAEANI